MQRGTRGTAVTVTGAVPPLAANRGAATEVVPPPSVPLAFLVAAGVGMTGFGAGVALAADRVVRSPTNAGVVSAVHVGVLAFLSIAVLGALHQFAPVVGRRPLRSVLAARLSFVGMLLTAWGLPTGFAHGPEWVIPTAGVIGAATVLLIAWNLSGPLASPDAGLPGWGMRCSVTFLIGTVAFGVVYAFNRQTGWFPLFPNRVLAHAHLGLIGWLGLTYVSVAEKLWPMFLLSHRPKARSGAIAVWSFAGGIVLLTPGLLFAIPALAWAGGLIVGVGAVAHLTSLVAYVRHRRRALELLHVYLFVSAAFLVTAMVLALLIGAAPVSTLTRIRLVAAEVAALIAWLALAVTGHAHKIVPFIGYSVLRSRGIATMPSGKPLLFGDLFAKTPARIGLALGGLGFAVVLSGILSGTAALVVAGATAVGVCGALTTVNLVVSPLRVIRAASRCPDDASSLIEGGVR